MKITPEYKQKLEDMYQQFLHDEKVMRMEKIPMHRGSNCYYHSFKVAKLAIKRGLRHKNVNLEVILIGAILHDYYLYNWREDKRLLKKHGKKHPYIAAQNAEEDFLVSDSVQKVIKSHMWPINITEFPDSKEARIVTLADKTIALREALTSKAHKQKRKDKYLKHIEKLF